jgi:hypothetical protein
MKTIRIALILFVSMFFSFEALSQELPPKSATEVYVLVPPGMCTTGSVEIGTYKPGVNAVWTRNPAKVIDSCQITVEEEFIARYRLAARCVDAITGTPLGPWVRSLSGLGKPWPVSCPGITTEPPINPVTP